jgi:hypothetical protein
MLINWLWMYDLSSNCKHSVIVDISEGNLFPLVLSDKFISSTFYWQFECCDTKIVFMDLWRRTFLGALLESVHSKIRVLLS